jgi:hypothetical protein
VAAVVGLAMPRYYFALTDGDLSLADDEVGEELDHVEAARGRENHGGELPNVMQGR